MELTSGDLERLIDSAAADMAWTYPDDSKEDVTKICGLFAGKILTKFKEEEDK